MSGLKYWLNKFRGSSELKI